ncbi:hypothetical protein L3Y34_015123 [Caenorhabditis briggsae]|uniref:non-specific serine/threonine protein kinase n=2 Tax=Caenorhabditis briggsae TaxID=6238 RepID=A0AAE9DVS2_CAEBR|nr:hypothetical protein L3Y34_015122 [Caenorhabditis briggsae]ULU11464.1 hypothetical protein L3Y34_015123 [Caenorhabditis briggsae]
MELQTKDEWRERVPHRVKCPSIKTIVKPRKSLRGTAEVKLGPQLIGKNGVLTPFDFEGYVSDKSIIEQMFSDRKIIGSGDFGDVWRGENNGTVYAIKKSKKEVKPGELNKFKEVEMLHLLPHHPNLLRFHKAWIENNFIHIQTELCCMNLLEYGKSRLDEPIIYRFFAHILSGLRALHRNNYLHNDIKPENILVSFNLVFKLADFGLMRRADCSKGIEGDSCYLAPEVLTNGTSSKESDVYALGVAILETATNLHLDTDADYKVKYKNFQIPDRFFAGRSDGLRSLIQRMMNLDASKRPTCVELLNEPRIFENLSEREKTSLKRGESEEPASECSELRHGSVSPEVPKSPITKKPRTVSPKSKTEKVSPKISPRISGSPSTPVRQPLPVLDISSPYTSPVVTRPSSPFQLERRKSFDRTRPAPRLLFG